MKKAKKRALKKMVYYAKDYWIRYLAAKRVEQYYRDYLNEHSECLPDDVVAIYRSVIEDCRHEVDMYLRLFRTTVRDIHATI
jgi:hypothetical protein